jgi:hypothetical protein
LDPIGRLPRISRIGCRKKRGALCSAPRDRAFGKAVGLRTLVEGVAGEQLRREVALVDPEHLPRPQQWQLPVRAVTVAAACALI